MINNLSNFQSEHFVPVNIMAKKEIIAIYDAIGRETQTKINTLQFIKFSDGTIERRIFIKE